MGDDSTQPRLSRLRQRRNSTGDTSIHRKSGGIRRRFPPGTVVEVRTNEKDCKGVFFSATVIAPPNSPRKGIRNKANRFYVEYHDLLVNDDGSDRLREYVGESFVRPLPPLLAGGFEVDDVVDAFYKDGWWKGVVSQSVDGGERFVVTFVDPPDELEFGASELRAHWDWVKGNWVRPQKQSLSELMFDVGRKVEVSFDGEDFQDAWFPATIRENLGNGTFSVGCTNANTDSSGVFPDVTVDSFHIRPCPPLLKDKNFVSLEKVDAFFDLGWWSGIITKQLESSRYLVYLKKKKCNKEFDQSELRLHMDWKNGKWFASSQPQEPPIPFLDLDVPFLDDGVCQHPTLENTGGSATTAALNNSIDGEYTHGGKPHPSLISRKGHAEPFVPDNMKLTDVTKPLSKRKAYIDSEGAPSQPSKTLKDENIVGVNKKARHDESEKEVISGFVSPESLGNMENSLALSTLDQSSSDQPWEENVQRKQRNSRTPQNFGGIISSIASSLSKRSGQIPTLESLEIDGEEKDPDTSGRTEAVTQNGHDKRDTGLHVVIGLPCAEAGSSGFGISSDKSRLSKKKTVTIMDDVKKVYASTNQKIMDGKQSVFCKTSDRRRKGTPKRNVAGSTKTPVTGDANRKDDDSERIREVAYIEMEASLSKQEDKAANQENTAVKQKKELNNQLTPGKRKVAITKRMLNIKDQSDNVEEPARPVACHSWKRGRNQISSGKISVKVRDFGVAPGNELAVVSHPMEVEKSVEPSSNDFENEPLSKWIEEMNISSAIDNSKLLPVNGDNQSNCVVLDQVNGKQTDSEKQSLSLVDIGDIASTEPQSLPSVNSTVAVVLDEATQKQSKSGEQTTLVDEVSTIASEPQGLPSVEEMTVVSLDQDSQKQPENGTALVQIDPENLPFVKSTILWKTVEAMEVFQKTPQKPHFQPLADFKESLREGLAIGYMVTFSSLVEKTCRLQITDPMYTMFDIKESLAELEKYGFDVRAVDECINQLIAAKDREEKLVHDASILDNQITEHNDMKTQVERDIDEMNEQIAILQKKISLAKSAIEQKDEEIAFLMARQRETNDNIENVKSEFNGIVSSIM